MKEKSLSLNDIRAVWHQDVYSRIYPREPVVEFDVLLWQMYHEEQLEAIYCKFVKTAQKSGYEVLSYDKFLELSHYYFHANQRVDSLIQEEILELTKALPSRGRK
jgi:hypothetical protein